MPEKPIQRIYFTLSGYIDIEAEDGEKGCDIVEAMPTAELIERSKVSEIECEY